MDNSPASTVASSISPRSSKTSNRLSLRLSDVLSAVSAHEFRYNPAAMAQTHYDVIIIGAGMSGMAAGIRLAYFDKSVCVLEQHYASGGLNYFYAVDGPHIHRG